METIKKIRLRITPVKMINGEDFEFMGCEIVFRRKKKSSETLFSDFAIKRLLEPVSKIMEGSAFENIKDEVKRSGFTIFDLKDDFSFFDFKCAEEDYKVFFHRFESSKVFALLLRRLNHDEENELKNKHSKLIHIGSQIIGDKEFSDFIKTEAAYVTSEGEEPIH